MTRTKKRRGKRNRNRRISFGAMLVLLLLMLLIPLLVYWFGVRRADRIVPDYATGYVTEEPYTTDLSDAGETNG